MIHYIVGIDFRLLALFRGPLRDIAPAILAWVVDAESSTRCALARVGN